jgi:hypothetical protein
MADHEYVTYFTGGVEDQHETGGRVGPPPAQRGVQDQAGQHRGGQDSGHPHREERRLRVGGGIQPRVQEPLRHATGSLATRHTSGTVVSGPRAATSLRSVAETSAKNHQPRSQASIVLLGGDPDQYGYDR